MKTQHVRSDLWRQTLDGLIRAEPEVVDRPLRGVSSDRGGVTIRLAEPAGLHLEHLVAHPADAPNRPDG